MVDRDLLSGLERRGMKILFSGLVVLSLAASASGCNREQQKPAGGPPVSGSQTSATTTVIAQVTSQGLSADSNSPLGPQKSIFSEQGTGVAYIVERQGSFYMVHNGVVGKAYNQIDEDIALSRDGRRIAYGAMAGSKWHLIVDGAEGAPVDGVTKPRFSPDGKHVAYAAYVGTRYHLVIDGKMNGEGLHDFLALFFSDDSARVITLEQSAQHDPAGQLVIRDLDLKPLNKIEALS